MYIDEMMLYMLAACVSGGAFVLLLRGWNRPFFREGGKATEEARSGYPMPMPRRSRHR